MGRFASAVLADGRGLRGQVVDPEQLHASFERQNGHVALAFDAQQALTWFRDARSADVYGPSVQHGGGLPGHHSAFVLLTGHGLGVAVSTNSDRGAAIVNHLAWRALSLAIEADTGKEPHPRPASQVEAKETFAPGERQRWIGVYSTPLGDLDVRSEDDALYVQALGRRLELKPLVGGGVGVFAEFLGLWDIQPDAFAELRFSALDVGSREVVVVDHRARRQLLAVEYEPVKATGPWRDRVGFYRIVHRAGDFEFLSGVELHLGTSGQLALRPVLRAQVEGVPGSTALRPLDDHQAVTEGLGRNHGVRIAFDAAENLHMSGLAFRRVPVDDFPKPRPKIRRGAPRAGEGVRRH
jgi:hypothetical protein